MNAIKLKDINYSSPTGYYKVKIISNCEWKGVKNLRLGISLGGRNHEGDRLFALLEWAGLAARLLSSRAASLDTFSAWAADSSRAVCAANCASITACAAAAASVASFSKVLADLRVLVGVAAASAAAGMPLSCAANASAAAFSWAARALRWAARRSRR